jgi:hypothetical protein
MGASRDRAVTAVSSETVGLNINGLDVLGDVEPGEAVLFSKGGLERQKLAKCNRRAFCGFEFSYFARPDSIINGKPIYKVREEFGRNVYKCRILYRQESREGAGGRKNRRPPSQSSSVRRCESRIGIGVRVCPLTADPDKKGRCQYRRVAGQHQRSRF